MQKNSLEYALGIGLPVFPCKNRPFNPETDKAPLTSHGFKDASADPAAIRAMFGPHRDCLIGVPTGAVSGIDFLDIDGRNGGGEWYDANRHRLPPTRKHRTRSGGLHLLFKHAVGLCNSTSKIAHGVDVRADGGYAIWWPAIGLPFEDYPLGGLPEWPEWLLELLLEQASGPKLEASQGPPAVKNDFSPRYVLAAYERELRAVAEAEEGTRNTNLHRAAIKLGTFVAAGALARSDVERALFSAAEASGLTATAILKTIASGMNYGLVRPRSAPKTKGRGHAV